MTEKRLWVFFDGYCGLCNRFVNLLLKIDRKDRLVFSALQSERAKSELKDASLEGVDSIVIKTHKQQIKIKSDAVLYVLNHLGGGWKIFNSLKVLPRNFRDRIYDFIAKNRYRIFGKKDTCRMPTPQERKKILF